MNDSPLISVIVPVYKVETYLDQCVQSIVDQTYQNLEIILVDDGSPDCCPALCDAWAEKEHRIKVIHKENGGLSDARNAGLAVATGKYISFIDSDDWIAKEMLERLYIALQRDGSDIAACTVEMVWEDGTPSRLLTVQTNCVLDRQEAQAALLKEATLKQPVWYKLYRKEIIEGIPFEVGKYHEDVFWSYQAIGNAKRVSVIDYIGYCYLQRKGSIMGEGYSLKRLDAVEAKVRRQEYLEEEMPELAKMGLIDLFFTCIYHGQMALKYLKKAEQSEVFNRIGEVMQRIPRKSGVVKTLPLTDRIWVGLTTISLIATCRLRNILHIGE